MNPSAVPRVSVHGGHSGEFCHHAEDSLDEVIRAYVDQGFSWVGITEHMPPLHDDHRYADEIEAGDSAADLQERFDRYVEKCRLLRQEYSSRIEVLVAFEIETYTGSERFVRELDARHEFDYFVGSLHHVDGIGIDVSEHDYQAAVRAQGGLEALYVRYFDLQHAMIESLEPAVVGHFDLIRIFDKAFHDTLGRDAVRGRIRRNLQLMRDLGLILDVNLRGFDRPAEEQYPAREVLSDAIALGVAVVPGDDSHGVRTVGRNWERGIAVLHELGCDLRWKKPKKPAKPLQR